MTRTTRFATARDAQSVLAIYRPIIEDTCISFELEAPDASEVRRRIRETLETYPWLVCEEGDELLGYSYAGRHRTREAYRWSVEVSVYVHPRAQRRGVARCLYDALLAVLGEQGFQNAHAGITLPNDASVRFHESCGFEQVARYANTGYKLGAWHDVGWWQKQLGLLPKEPQAPQPLSQLAGNRQGSDWLESIISGRSP